MCCSIPDLHYILVQQSHIFQEAHYDERLRLPSRYEHSWQPEHLSSADQHTDCLHILAVAKCAQRVDTSTAPPAVHISSAFYAVKLLYVIVKISVHSLPAQIRNSGYRHSAALHRSLSNFFTSIDLFYNKCMSTEINAYKK
jgi:hypothetical protein